jgi:hypothetical protein
MIVLNETVDTARECSGTRRRAQRLPSQSSRLNARIGARVNHDELTTTN